MELTAIGFRNGGHGENERLLHRVPSAHLEEDAPRWLTLKSMRGLALSGSRGVLARGKDRRRLPRAHPSLRSEL